MTSNTHDGIDITWDRDLLFPLREAFHRMVHGSLEERLFESAKEGNSAAVFRWLTRGANINAEEGRALQIAFANDHDNTTAMLLAYGADPTALPPGVSPKSFTLNVQSKKENKLKY